MIGRPLDRSERVRHFNEALARAAVHRATIHGLRHTSGTTMAGAGESQRNTQGWMGHDDLITTQVCMHCASRRDEVDAVDRAFS